MAKLAVNPRPAYSRLHSLTHYSVLSLTHLDDSMALDSISRYIQTNVLRLGDSLDTPLSVSFPIFCPLIPLALKTQSYIVFDGKCPCYTKKPYLVISFVQARPYGVRTSVTHLSALESLSKFTDLLTGMGNGFTGNGKL